MNKITKTVEQKNNLISRLRLESAVVSIPLRKIHISNELTDVSQISLTHIKIKDQVIIRVKQVAFWITTATPKALYLHYKPLDYMSCELFHQSCW